MCEKWKDEVESMYVRNTSDKRMTVSIGKKCLLPNNKKKTKQNRKLQSLFTVTFCLYAAFCFLSVFFRLHVSIPVQVHIYFTILLCD